MKIHPWSMGPIATMEYEQALMDYVARTSQLPSIFLVAPPTSQLYYVLLRMDLVDQETSCWWLHPVSPFAGKSQCKAGSQHRADQEKGSLGELWSLPRYCRSHKHGMEAEKPRERERDAAKSPTTHKFCLAPNFNLFPQASTRAALYYLIFLLLIFCPRCAAKQLHAKEEWTYQEDSFVFGTWAVVN